MSIYHIWISRVFGANCRNGMSVAGLNFSRQQLYEDRHRLKTLNVFTQNQIEKAESTDLERLKPIEEIHLEKGIKSLWAGDENYPKRFLNIARCPLVLYYRGDERLFNPRHTVGIIGSRHCTGEGESACEMITARLAKAGVCVISGIAQGADGIAHRTAIANGGKTVGFSGVGAGEYFPLSNKKLQQQMEKEHLVISEYPAKARYYSSNFIGRNRLIAAMSDRLCVVQAKEKSGSLATVNRALEYDRPVFAVPGSIFSENFKGSNRLLEQGKAMAVCEGETILNYLGIKNNPAQKTDLTAQKLADMGENAQKLYRIIKEPMFIGRIIKESGLPAGAVKALLAQLEMEGLVVKSATGEYIRKK